MSYSKHQVAVWICNFFEAACTYLLAGNVYKSTTTTFLYENVTVPLNMCSVFRFVWRFPNVTFFALLPVLFFFLRFIALSKQNITLLCYKYSPVYKLAAVIRRYFPKFLSLHRFTRSWKNSLIRLA